MSTPAVRPGPTSRQRLLGLVVAVVVLAVVAAPAGTSAALAVLALPTAAAFSAFYAALAVALLALPVLAGVLVARAAAAGRLRGRRTWVAAAVVGVVALAAASYLSRVM